MHTETMSRPLLAGATLVALTIGGACGTANAPGAETTVVTGPTDPISAAAPTIKEMFAGGVEIIDLTHSLSPSAVAWGATSPFEYEAIRTQPSGAVSMGAYSTPEHHGTHLDAPIHGGDNLPTVDELTPNDLFGPAAVIDVSAQSAADPDYAVTRQDILDWEERNGELPVGAIVLMYSGWSEKYDDADAYRNPDDDGRMHFPGFSEAAARFLIEERNIRGIGVDTLSVDPGAARGFAAHGVVNGNGKFHLENVANVHLLPQAGAYLIVAPIKIEGGSGGQVRIFAVIP
ncbi:MAG: cyclase family protein [Acidobacteria bacterium]|nr:cyclase family protein [Acidobacteriota bacterium]